MTPQLAVDLLKQLVERIFMVSAPLLITAMVTGLIVSLIQTITSLQEQTLSFVPKALIVLGVLLLIMPWAMQMIMDYTVGVITMMGQISR
ncbi:MAG: flagellar biosynthetic protein FliQ [Verrucomicrobiota bacterium]|jgi:flagellar biosynthetic protein FliQ